MTTAAGQRGPSLLGRILDLASDWAVLAYGIWTLVAYAGIVTQARVSLLVPIWLAFAALAAALLVYLSRRRVDAVAGEPDSPPPRPVSRGMRIAVIAAIAAGLFSALVAAATEKGSWWPLVWIGAFAAAAAAVALGRLTSARMERPPAAGWLADAFAALVGVVFAGMSLFISRPAGDDAFYVNRATAVAELNRIPVRDVLFTDELVPPTSAAGLPIDTFSALEGALGRLLGVEGASVAYYLFPPLMTFLATWALWRLVRSWAPRHLALCFVLGCVFWLFSAETRLTSGSYFLARIWEGKVAFVAWMVMTLYVYLTRWLGKRDALTAVLIAAGGVSSIGMTSSASFVAPLLFGTAAVPLLARRDWRGLPVVATAAAFPFVVGFVATQKYPLWEDFRGGVFGSSWYFHDMFGPGLLAGLGLVAVWAAPYLARSGPPARLATGVAIVTVLLLAPGVLRTVSDLADLTGTLRRTMWIVPLPALVGLLAAVPLQGLAQRVVGARPARVAAVAAAAVTLVLAGSIVAFGQPLWETAKGQSYWVSRPRWKTSQARLADARAILARYEGTGAVLAEERVMFALALETANPKAVNARKWYALLTPEPPGRIDDRLNLTAFVEGKAPMPPDELRRALTELEVGVVCADEAKRPVIREVEETGLYAEAFRVRGLVCLERRGSAR
jgi:hypothetical protein